MAKVKGPLMSLDASGSIAGAMTFSKWKGVNYVRQLVIPTYTNTTKQGLVRLLIKQATEAWKGSATVGGVDIDSDYKLAYATAAAGMALSGFNLFVRECVQKNYNSAGSPVYDGTLAVPSEPGDITP